MTLDTIVARATPEGRGGIAVIRISGNCVKEIAQQILNKTLQPRIATHTLFFGINQQVLDEGIAIFFPSPHSFTGEDVLELQGHGGTFVVNNLIERIVELGARIAKPGEFSERAFLNNKIDLIQAEAIADLIDAESIDAARAAVRSLQGDFSKKIESFLLSLIQLRMYVEASIDFSDEEIDFLQDEKIALDLQKLKTELKNIMDSAFQGSLLRQGITVVIAGRPNVGKSSLLNVLSGKDIAIVTDIAGTTRDILREQIVMDGIPLHIIDTAGLRESTDIVEQEGIKRARQEMIQADILLLMINASDELQELQQLIPNISVNATTIIIRNKIDLTNESPHIQKHENKIVISLSVKNNAGVDLLKQQLKTSAGFKMTAEGVFSARARHLDALKRAENFIKQAEAELQRGELLAENLRQTQLALNEITGEFTSDDLLGKIFSSFCIGK